MAIQKKNWRLAINSEVSGVKVSTENFKSCYAITSPALASIKSSSNEYQNLIKYTAQFYIVCSHLQSYLYTQLITQCFYHSHLQLLANPTGCIINNKYKNTASKAPQMNVPHLKVAPNAFLHCHKMLLYFFNVNYIVYSLLPTEIKCSQDKLEFILAIFASQ